MGFDQECFFPDSKLYAQGNVKRGRGSVHADSITVRFISTMLHAAHFHAFPFGNNGRILHQTTSCASRALVRSARETQFSLRGHRALLRPFRWKRGRDSSSVSDSPPPPQPSVSSSQSWCVNVEQSRAKLSLCAYWEGFE